MKYRKPEVLDLGGHMKNANGQEIPYACVAGPAAGLFETCATGGTPGVVTSCVPGAAASEDGDCLSGSSVYFYCENGSGGGDDYETCHTGPSYVQLLSQRSKELANFYNIYPFFNKFVF